MSLERRRLDLISSRLSPVAVRGAGMAVRKAADGGLARK